MTEVLCLAPLRLTVRPGQRGMLDLRKLLARWGALLDLRCPQPRHGCLEWNNGLLCYRPDTRRWAGVERVCLALRMERALLLLPVRIEVRRFCEWPRGRRELHLHVQARNDASLQTPQQALDALLGVAGARGKTD